MGSLGGSFLSIWLELDLALALAEASADARMPAEGEVLRARRRAGAALPSQIDGVPDTNAR